MVMYSLSNKSDTIHVAIINCVEIRDTVNKNKLKAGRIAPNFVYSLYESDIMEHKRVDYIKVKRHDEFLVNDHWDTTSDYGVQQEPSLFGQYDWEINEETNEILSRYMKHYLYGE